MSKARQTALDAALAYAERGWSVIPIAAKTKKAAVGWKRFQMLRAPETLLREWFDGKPDRPLAIVGGAVSRKLVIRDYDEADAFHRWADAYAELAATLPRVRTGRGFHVYLRSDDQKYRKLPDGEYRGEGHYTLAPPSPHPDGGRYEWEIPLPDGDLPLVDPVEGGLVPQDTTAPPKRISDRGATATADRPEQVWVPAGPGVWPPVGLTNRTMRFLKIGAPHGERNDELFLAACDMASRGIDITDATDRLLDGCARCQPAYPEREALATIASAYGRPRWQATSAADPWGVYVVPRHIAQRRDLNPSDKLVWAALDYRQRDKEDCFPKLETIAADTGLARCTANESVKRLEGKNLVEVERAPRNSREPNHYRTRLGEMPQPPESPEVGKSDSNTIAAVGERGPGERGGPRGGRKGKEKQAENRGETVKRPRKRAGNGKPGKKK